MKTTSYLLYFLLIHFLSFCQQSTQIPQFNYSGKGKLVLSSGVEYKFINIVFKNDSAICKISNYRTEVFAIDKVYKINKTKNFCVIGAITFGVAGLVGSVLGTAQWNQNSDLKNKKGYVIIGSTIGSAIIGAIIGLCFKKDIIIYKNKNLTTVTKVNFKTEHFFVRK